MWIQYFIMGIIFIFVLMGWILFETGLIFKAVEIMERERLDKNKKKF